MKTFKMMVIGLVTILCIQKLTYAGVEVGNGGDVVVCEKNKVELLDFYEARVIRGININLGAPDLSIDQKLNIVFTSIAKKSPLFAEELKKGYSTFFENVLFLTNIELTDIPDSQQIALPTNCEIKQIAIQKRPVFPEDHLYTINKDLWDFLDNDSKAGLILHEILYGMAISVDEQNSIGTRYMNSLITSRKIEGMTSKDIYNSFVRAGFQWIDIQSIKINLKTYKYDVPGGRWAESNEYVYFYENGNIRNIDFEYSDYTFNDVKLKIFGEASFYENGVPEMLRLISDVPVDLMTIQGHVETFWGDCDGTQPVGGYWNPTSKVYLNEAGRVITGCQGEHYVNFKE